MSDIPKSPNALAKHGYDDATDPTQKRRRIAELLGRILARTWLQSSARRPSLSADASVPQPVGEQKRKAIDNDYCKDRLTLPMLGNQRGTMDIATLAARTAIPARQLRYVIDHKLLPGLKLMPGRGVPRDFIESEAFAIALAALMLGSGLKKGLVESCIKSVLRWDTQTRETSNEVPLIWAFRSSTSSLELGDGTCYRIQAINKTWPKIDFDSGWISLEGQVVPEKYRPLVNIVIDLAALKGKIGRVSF